MADTPDQTSQLVEQVQQAFQDNQPLNVQGSGSKRFLREPDSTNGAQTLSTSEHAGVVSYEPKELVIRARSGTKLSVLQQVLADQHQQLPFEPPQFDNTDTLGGVIACGLSGPARPYVGAARDFVLGVTLINGQGQHLSFGGDVIKNVAGYDVSRLQVGAMGTLGVMLEISMKVLPQAETVVTVHRELSRANDTSGIQSLTQTTLPVTGSAVHEKQQWIRLAGTEAAVQAALVQIEGDKAIDQAGQQSLWTSLANHQYPFFNSESRSTDSLWRIAVPAKTTALPIKGRWLFEWGGAQRWLWSDEPSDSIRAECEKLGGHATCYRRGSDNTASVFHPVHGKVGTLHQLLRQSFDPAGILNPSDFHSANKSQT